MFGDPVILASLLRRRCVMLWPMRRGLQRAWYLPSRVSAPQPRQGRVGAAIRRGQWVASHPTQRTCESERHSLGVQHCEQVDDVRRRLDTGRDVLRILGSVVHSLGRGPDLVELTAVHVIAHLAWMSQLEWVVRHPRNPGWPCRCSPLLEQVQLSGWSWACAGGHPISRPNWASDWERS